MGPSSQNCNVEWVAADSIAGCPAGDSLMFSHPSQHLHPSRMRVYVYYEDNDCYPKVGVPPDSIYVTYSIVSGTGNLKVNDQGVKVFADDSTNAEGKTWITIPSFSGCGKVRLFLTVSGKSVGYVTRVVRTVDTDASGRALGADYASACDVNYDGAVTGVDLSIIASHLEHWHRNVLHGALVRRTNFCETCPPEEVGTKGDSEVSWSPSQRYIALTSFVDASPFEDPACKVFLVPSDPKDGNDLMQLTFLPIQYHDYDPNWSPLNHEILFDRADSVIIRKGVPWSTQGELVVTASNNTGCGLARGDVMPAVSPDGKNIAFARCNGSPTGGWSLWMMPIGGTPTQLTPTDASTNFYPSWSPDGAMIYFQRIDPAIGPQWHLFRVPTTTGTLEMVFAPPLAPPDTFDIVQPALSPDGKVIVAGYGRRDTQGPSVFTHTLDPELMSPTPDKLIRNYNEPRFAVKSSASDFPILSPRVSPDGTRLVLGSKQVWATRPNMSLPPTITQIGSTLIADTTTSVTFTVFAGTTTLMSISTSDPEADPVECAAYYLPTWMTFNPSACSLILNPPSGASGSYNVVIKSTTPSGGSDAVVAVFNVRALAAGAGQEAIATPDAAQAEPNPEKTSFAVWAPKLDHGDAELAIYDVTGRRVTSVRGPSEGWIAWDGKDTSGRPVAAGVYLYRMTAGEQRREGAFVVVR